jgi:hypothetical protein
MFIWSILLFTSFDAKALLSLKDLSQRFIKDINLPFYQVFHGGIGRCIQSTNRHFITFGWTAMNFLEYNIRIPWAELVYFLCLVVVVVI